MTLHRPGVPRPALLATTLLLAAGVAAAHDFWIIPTAFQLPGGAVLELRGQTSSRFPTSEAAVAVERVAEARLIGAATDERITDLSVSGRSLLLRHRPAGEGQFLVAVALVARPARTTPQQLQRFIALEGAPQLAERYAREGRYPAVDSLTRTTAKFAKTIVEAGSGGGRAFDRVAGHALEIIPLNDPSRLRTGDTVQLRVLYHGQPVAHGELHGGPAADSTAPASAHANDRAATTGADGIARLVVDTPGLWNVRIWYGAPGREPDWEVHAASLVFAVGRR